MECLRRLRQLGERLVAMPAAGGSLALVLAAFALPAAAQVTPAGTRIPNVARVAALLPGGVGTEVLSDTAVVTVGRSGALTLGTGRRDIVYPGATTVLAHMLGSTQNGRDSVRVTVSSRRGWTVRVHRDTDGNSRLDPNDAEITSVAFAAHDSVALLVVVAVPEGAGGVTDTLTLRAESTIDNAVRTTVDDMVEVRTLSMDVALTKDVQRRTVRAGESVLYTLRWRTSVDVADAIVVDTLPEALRPGGTEPVAEMTGRVVRWRLGALAAGSAGVVRLEATVAATVAVGTQFRNVAAIEVSGRGTVRAEAPVVTVEAPARRSVALRHDADLLEIGLGGTAPISVTVQNTGDSPLGDTRVVVRLPAGLRLVPASVVGADSARIEGSTITWHLAGPIAPGASRRLRYVVAASSGERPAFALPAVAESGADVRSPEAVARLVLRRDLALQTRAAIGKVFVDADGNGRQSANEPGVAGVDVLTADGELSATDPDGRYSFANLRTGRTAFRMDPLSLPFDVVLPGGRGGALATRDQTGWASSHVDFALRPRGGTLVAVRVPLAWSLAVRRPCAADGGCALASSSVGSIPIQGAVLDELRAEYTLVLHNPAGAPLSDVQLQLPPGADSASVRVGSGTFVPAATPLRLAIGARDSVTVQFRGKDHSTLPLALAAGGREVPFEAAVASGNDVRTGLTPPLVADTALPVPAPAATMTADVTLAAPDAGWPGSAVYALPVGWSALPGTSRQEAQWLAEPRTVRGRDGGSFLEWAGAREGTPVTVRLTRVATAPAGAVRVAALRDEAARADQSAELMVGPGVAFFAPVDGTVLATDRLFVGVRGEPGRPVTLFDGDSMLANGTTRLDGVHDFINVQLGAGPHRLRARLDNSWGQARWDSATVHVNGGPARFVAVEDTVQLMADGRSSVPVRIRVVDVWGVPVTHPTAVTVRASGARLAGADEDRSSVGDQRRSDAAGWVVIPVVAGRDAGGGALELRADSVRLVLPLRQQLHVRPLVLTGTGVVGTGAAPDAFGAVSAQGRLGSRTALSLTWDSRRLDAGRERFGRDQDPLESSQVPLLGDASLRRTRAASQYRLAARVERDRDWMAFGDLTTTGFAQGLSLAGYRRALAGAAGSVGAGPLSVQGFVSSSRQSLRQLQLRGTGSSGPYLLAAGMLPGTELVRLESRALENTARITSQQALVRYVDYQVDYDQGTLVFKQPVAASDSYGNPLFVVVTYETRGGDAPLRGIWGVRAVADAGRSFGRRAAGRDTMLVGGTVIRDGAASGIGLASADVQVGVGGRLRLRGEVAQSTARDSSGVAASVEGQFEALHGGLRLSAQWTRIGTGFANPSMVSLRGGTEELRLRGTLRVGTTDLTLEHDAQDFGPLGVQRARTAGGLVQGLGAHARVEARLASDHFTAATEPTGARSLAQEVTLTVTPTARLKLWGEGRQRLTRTVNAMVPNVRGVGASLSVTPDVSLETRYRQLSFGDATPGYGVANVGVRARVAAGTDAWSSYQLAGVNGAYNAAIVGLGHRLVLGQDWAVNTLVERRQGVSRALLADPVRALPFAQPEEDYWTAAGGVEFLRRDAPYRLSARGEWRDGTLRANRLATLAGDVSIRRGLAVLARQNVQWVRQMGDAAPLESRQLVSLLGVALRPVTGNALNLLGKVEWVQASNLFGAGVLARRGDESRLIGSAEAIWQPWRMLELQGRVARRDASAALPAMVAAQGAEAGPSGNAGVLRSRANFGAARVSIGGSGLVGLRVDARMLDEREGRTTRWDVAPQLMVVPAAMLEVGVGYRLGDLRDPDFAMVGGRGAFVTLGARLTEATAASVADVWRGRLAGERAP